MHVFDLLDQKELPIHSVVAITGTDRFLQTLAVQRLEELWMVVNESQRLDGDSLEWRDVTDELDTRQLFGSSSHRVIVLDPADSFIRDNRDRLEAQLKRGKSNGSLVLVAKKIPGNTRLGRELPKHGLHVKCAEPTTMRGRREYPDSDRSQKWLMRWAKKQYSRQLKADAALRLWDRVGPIYGLLDQEIAKLALYTDQVIDVQLVEAHCGSWRTKTTWEMIDAALDGKTNAALWELDKLLAAGEAPIALFGQLSWSLRRYATAARVYDFASRSGKRMTLREAIQAGGFRWPKEIEQAERRIRSMGRKRAMKLSSDLLELDLKLKGSHSKAGRARQAIELFFHKL